MFFRISSSTISPSQIVIDGVNYTRSNNNENFVIRELSKGIAFESELTNLKLDVRAKHFNQIVNLDAVEHLYKKRSEKSNISKKRRLNDDILIDYAQKHIVKKRKVQNISENDYYHSETNLFNAIKYQQINLPDLACVALSFILKASYTSSIHNFVSLFQIGNSKTSDVGYNYLDINNATYLVGWELNNCPNGKVKAAVDRIMEQSRVEVEELKMICFKVEHDGWYANVKMVLWENDQPSIDGPKVNEIIDLTK
ncbi:unnamed protein product [Candida verbasci]|uniref:Uncharacterized protein n=1 Tax=Candida verbasci TaxID=1227364 RepID=A0A9W4XNG6_9ASCO|nr:unnamed protein product [Candida verbasci]